jgi:acetyl esterase/lipase
MTDKFDIPIVSVDYSLSPKVVFPRATEEVFYAYCWFLKNSAYCGSTLEKVVMLGESAGSSIIIGLIIKCIEHEVRIPDNFVNVYGACILNYSTTPSRFLSVIDPFLPLHLMLRAVKAYLVDEKINITNEKSNSREFDLKLPTNPMISPMNVSDEILKKFPSLSFICASMDPLLDDNIAFAKKLNNLGVIVTMKVVEKMSHGFLVFNKVSKQ